MRGDDYDQDDRECKPEDPFVREVIDDHTAQYQPGAATDTESRADQTDRGRDLLGRKLVPDDPEGEREDRATDTLNCPPQDENRDRVREGGDKRPQPEEGEGHEEHALLAEHVAEPPDDRRRNGRGQQVDGQYPGDRRR